MITSTSPTESKNTNDYYQNVETSTSQLSSTQTTCRLQKYFNTKTLKENDCQRYYWYLTTFLIATISLVLSSCLILYGKKVYDSIFHKSIVLPLVLNFKRKQNSSQVYDNKNDVQVLSLHCSGKNIGLKFKENLV